MVALKNDPDDDGRHAINLRLLMASGVCIIKGVFVVVFSISIGLQ